MLRKGRQPLELKKFETVYSNLITQLKAKTSASIVLTTLSCINEYLDSETNLLRKKYNNVINKIAKQTDCFVADVSEKFDSVLKENKQTNYLLEKFFHSVYIDKKICKKPNGAETLSKKRHLWLTIDGVHLNKEGALIYKEIIEQTIKTADNRTMFK